MMKQLLLLILLSCCNVCAWADVAVIVNPHNKVELSEAEIRKIFLGRTVAFPNGMMIEAYDNQSDISDVFLAKVLRKEQSSLNSYWARMMFSGKAKPPRPVHSDAVALERVAANKAAISFVDAESVNTGVRVIARIKR